MSSPRRRALVGLAGAVAFGIAAGWLKGDGPGLRGGVGNLSAPWLLVGLLPAARCRTTRGGVLVGTASTLVALVAFYVSQTVLASGQLGGGGFGAELRVELAANRIYLLFGVVTGPLVGAAGAALSRRSSAAVWAVAGLLLAAEVGVVALVAGRQLLPAPVYFRWGVDDWTPYAAESALGVVVLLGTVLAAGSRRVRASRVA